MRKEEHLDTTKLRADDTLILALGYRYYGIDIFVPIPVFLTKQMVITLPD
ncbi:hypothetical protein DSL72_006506 [Monilinia vaccinii-corymbosi]|uniref:Uncharacterized protein n=1 Tax=Monilinia vaccinii-corymbosi TaxID=61207 RepID=A0A8A3PP78_9HELO|nr:hypothetical protein DSL72_006506 [Monilinia vaccinii-corymbosi]